MVEPRNQPDWCMEVPYTGSLRCSDALRMYLGMELDTFWVGKQSRTPHKHQNRRNQGCKWRLTNQVSISEPDVWKISILKHQWNSIGLPPPIDPISALSRGGQTSGFGGPSGKKHFLGVISKGKSGTSCSKPQKISRLRRKNITFWEGALFVYYSIFFLLGLATRSQIGTAQWSIMDAPHCF